MILIYMALVDQNISSSVFRYIDQRISRPLRAFLTCPDENDYFDVQSLFGWKRCMRYYNRTSSIEDTAAMHDHMFSMFTNQALCVNLAKLGRFRELEKPKVVPPHDWVALAIDQAIEHNHMTTVIVLIQMLKRNKPLPLDLADMVIGTLSSPQLDSLMLFLGLIDDPCLIDKNASKLVWWAIRQGSKTLAEYIVGRITPRPKLTMPPKWRPGASVDDCLRAVEVVAILYRGECFAPTVIINLARNAPCEEVRQSVLNVLEPDIRSIVMS